MPETGARIGGYEVRGRLGEGGMSEVWLAEHAELDRGLRVAGGAVLPRAETCVAASVPRSSG